MVEPLRGIDLGTGRDVDTPGGLHPVNKVKHKLLMLGGGQIPCDTVRPYSATIYGPQPC